MTPVGPDPAASWQPPDSMAAVVQAKAADTVLAVTQVSRLTADEAREAANLYQADPLTCLDCQPLPCCLPHDRVPSAPKAWCPASSATWKFRRNRDSALGVRRLSHESVRQKLLGYLTFKH